MGAWQLEVCKVYVYNLVCVLIACWGPISYIVIAVVAIYVFLAMTYNIMIVCLWCSCVFDCHIFSCVMFFFLPVCWCIVSLIMQILSHSRLFFFLTSFFFYFELFATPVA